jgi:uncharacterized membrane protein
MVVPIWYLGDRRYLKEVPIVASMKMTARSVETIRLPAARQIDYWDADHPGSAYESRRVAGRLGWRCTATVMYRHSNVNGG